MRTFLRVFVVALTTLIAGAITGTTSVGAATLTYDVAFVARVDIREINAGGLPTALLSGSCERSASPSTEVHGTATTSSRSVVATNKGSISYGALDDLGRPTGVSAQLTTDMVGTGSPAARSITPPGFGGGSAGHARGHLLGNQLGGSGTDARNLVTMFQNPANSPVMRSFENQVRTALDAGQVVNYAATPIYRGSGLMPVGITLRAQGSGGLDFFVSVLNRGL